MAHLTADTMTSGPAPAIHAGTNTQICRFSMGGTSSGSLTVHLTPLPAGAEVVNARVIMSNLIGTGNELVSVFATIGGTRVQTYLASASAASTIYGANALTTGGVLPPNGNWMGNRLSASAIAWLSLTNQVGTGTASCDFAVIIEYLARRRGD